MKPQPMTLVPDATIAGLAYELNAVALRFAAEAERLVRIDHGADQTRNNRAEIATQLHNMIKHLHETTMALRYARHSGQTPPARFY